MSAPPKPAAVDSKRVLRGALGFVVLAVTALVIWWFTSPSSRDATVPVAELPERIDGGATASLSSEPDPLVLPFAAWTRALLRGDVVAAWSGDERRNFPGADRSPWRRKPTLFSGDANAAAWLRALKRIAGNAEYRDLRGLSAEPPADDATDDAWSAYLGQSLLMGTDEGLVPLGPDPVSELEEFAVAGTGRVRFRNPEPGADEDRHLAPEPGDAIVLVLIAGQRTRAATAQQGPTGNVRSFLLAKSKATVSQVNPEAVKTSPGDPALRRLLRHARESEAVVMATLAAHGLRLPTPEEWMGAEPHAIEDAVQRIVGDGLAAKSRLVPNSLGLYGLGGSEWCAPRDASDPVAERVVLGGNYATEDDRSFGVRPARDVPAAERKRIGGQTNKSVPNAPPDDSDKRRSKK